MGRLPCEQISDHVLPIRSHMKGWKSARSYSFFLANFPAMAAVAGAHALIIMHIRIPSREETMTSTYPSCQSTSDTNHNSSIKATASKVVASRWYHLPGLWRQSLTFLFQLSQNLSKSPWKNIFWLNSDWCWIDNEYIWIYLIITMILLQADLLFLPYRGGKQVLT